MINENVDKKMSDYAGNLFPRISGQEALKLMNEADQAFENKEYRKAIRLFSQALNAPLTDANKGYILYMKGKAYHAIGDTGRACKQWVLAISLDLTHPTGVDLVSQAYEKHCL